MQHKLTWQRAVQEAEDGETRAKLFEQLYQLSDVILDGFRAQLDSIKRHYGDTTTRWNDVHERYTSTRGELLEPFSEYMSTTLALHKYMQRTAGAILVVHECILT